MAGAWRFVQCNWGARHLVNAKEVPKTGSKSGKSDSLRFGLVLFSFRVILVVIEITSFKRKHKLKSIFLNCNKKFVLIGRFKREVDFSLLSFNHTLDYVLTLKDQVHDYDKERQKTEIHQQLHRLQFHRIVIKSYRY